MKKSRRQDMEVKFEIRWVIGEVAMTVHIIHMKGNALISNIASFSRSEIKYT
jgi:hypothetical protein